MPDFVAAKDDQDGMLAILREPGGPTRHTLRDTNTRIVFEAGFIREGGEAYSPTAVRWWLMADDGDRFFFARGGRVANAQAAASELAGAHAVLQRERQAWRARATHELVGTSLVKRFTHELQEDGSLKPLRPTDFEIGGL